MVLIRLSIFIVHLLATGECKSPLTSVKLDLLASLESVKFILFPPLIYVISKKKKKTHLILHVTHKISLAYGKCKIFQHIICPFWIIMCLKKSKEHQISILLPKEWNIAAYFITYIYLIDKLNKFRSFRNMASTKHYFKWADKN